MARFFSILLWTAVFLLLLVGIDQLLVRVPAAMPVHVAVATFYRDLRSRGLDLARGIKVPATPVPAQPGSPAKGAPPRVPASVEAVIERHQAVPPKPPAVKPATKPSGVPASRYVYADARGDLHFADTLAEVPEQYRAKARSLGE